MKIENWPTAYTLDLTPQPLPKLDPALKAKWLAALRDPAAKQAKGALRYTDDSMCCLGVLCNIVAPDQWNRTIPPLTHQGEVLEVPFGDPEDHNVDMPPSGVLTLLNLPRSIAWFLAEHNDLVDPEGKVHQHTFADIADWIEENL